MITRTRLSSAALACLLGSSCVVPDGATPSVDIAVDAATKYVHRGMVQNENGVVQPSTAVVLPAKEGGKIVVRSWANMDLSNDTGDAWLPDGHAGKYSQIDFNLLYVQELDDLTITSGFTSYVLPNGTEFPFGERGQTSEFMVEGVYQLSESLLSIQPFLAVHYDYDEVEGFYVRGGAKHTHAFNEKTSLTTALSLGWMDDNMVFWNYGDPQTSGLADTTLRTTVDHSLAPHVTLTGFAEYSTIVDSDLRDWFGTLQNSSIDGIDPDQLYAGFGIRWSY